MRLFSTSDIARASFHSSQSVRRWIYSGKLPRPDQMASGYAWTSEDLAAWLVSQRKATVQTKAVERLLEVAA